MVSADLYDQKRRTVLEDWGSGHSILLADIPASKERKGLCNCGKVSWNFHKGNWKSFKEYLEIELDEIKIDFNKHPKSIVSLINKTIIQAAKRFIPRGKQRNYCCFWYDRLTELKNKHDEFRDKAQTNRDLEIVRDWRRSSAVLAREITEAKRTTFNEYISKLN